MWTLGQKKDKAVIDVKLETHDLLLRPARWEDCDEWIAVRSKNKDYLTPYEPSWPDRCLGEDFFLRRVERLNYDWNDDRCYAFLIFDRHANELIGGININNVTRGAAQYASLGYWISEDRQGRGWMTQAGAAILDFSFKKLRLGRMNAATLVHNQKSRNMLLRLGFVEEGFAKAYIQINGTRQDHILYGLNAEDFSGASR